MAKDYYKTLEVEKGASKEDIKKAYKKLAKKYHPDISQEKDAEAKFKEINEAASVLLDDEKKKRYDTYGSADGPSGFGGGGGNYGSYSSGGFNPEDFGINLDDIFEQFGFSGFGGRGFSQGRGRNDTTVHTEIELTLEDVYFGVKKEVKLERNVKCESCNGKGAKNSSDVIKCSTCSGNGVVIEMQRTILGSMRTQKICSKCQGTGEQVKNPCSSCHGSGAQAKKEVMEVSIPKGIESGVTLRVSGKGHYDRQTSNFGDLYLKVYIKKDETFDVDGSDLYMNLDLNFIQAILGDEVEFKHFKKTLSLKIPEGTQSGTILRLKGKGLPHFNYEGYGDLYVKANVILPEKTTKEQKDILLEYAKTLKDKSIFDRVKKIFK